MSAFIVWNARGVANASTATHLKFLVRQYKIQFFAILEPMCSFSNAI